MESRKEGESWADAPSSSACAACACIACAAAASRVSASESPRLRGGIPHWTKKEFGACIEWVSTLVFSTGDVGPKPTADAQPCTRTCDPGLSTVEVRGFGGGVGESGSGGTRRHLKARALGVGNLAETLAGLRVGGEGGDVRRQRTAQLARDRDHLLCTRHVEQRAQRIIGWIRVACPLSGHSEAAKQQRWRLAGARRTGGMRFSRLDGYRSGTSALLPSIATP